MSGELPVVGLVRPLPARESYDEARRAARTVCHIAVRASVPHDVTLEVLRALGLPVRLVGARS